MTDAAGDRDRCSCGAVVTPHSGSTVAGRRVERGSCRVCGLQLVRPAGDRWREIRG